MLFKKKLTRHIMVKGALLVGDWLRFQNDRTRIATSQEIALSTPTIVCGEPESSSNFTIRWGKYEHELRGTAGCDVPVCMMVVPDAVTSVFAQIFAVGRNGKDRIQCNAQATIILDADENPSVTENIVRVFAINKYEEKTADIVSVKYNSAQKQIYIQCKKPKHDENDSTDSVQWYVRCHYTMLYS